MFIRMGFVFVVKLNKLPRSINSFAFVLYCYKSQVFQRTIDGGIAHRHNVIFWNDSKNICVFIVTSFLSEEYSSFFFKMDTLVFFFKMDRFSSNWMN